MKNTKVMALILSFIMVVRLLPGALIISAADEEGAVEKEHLAYVAPDSAYTMLHGNLDSRNASFIDGISMGITDTKHESYYELVKEDGLEARKQYNANSTYINVDKSFFEAGDELLVSIVYYDYGPSEGTYYLEYYTTSGGTYQEKLIKPGRHPGWSVKTVVTDGLVPHGYANGATFRIQNGAFNAFRKIEIVNLSKQKREKIVPQIKSLHIEKTRTLEKMEIIPVDDPMFSHENLAKPVSVYDVQTYVNKYSMVKDAIIPAADKEKTMTQGEMLKAFMKMTGTDYSGQESIVDFAHEIGFVKSSAYFVFDDAPATYYNLGNLIYDVFDYEITPNNPLILQLYEKGFFGGKTIAQIANDTLSRVCYMGAKKNPYTVITDNTTGRTFFYINFYGSTLMRPYFSEQQWTLDGKRFLVGTESGLIYLYDTRTQLMHYIGQGVPSKNDSDGVVGGDGMIYYHGTCNGYNTFVRVDPDDPNLESKVVYTYPKGVTSVTEYIARDGSYFGGDIRDPYNALGVAPEGYHKVVTFFTKEGNVPGVPDYNYKVNYYKFPEPEKGTLNHVQANPVYPELTFFVHEANTAAGYEYYQMFDRTNIMNLDTGEVKPFNVGRFGRGAILSTTHESWSPDGEYLFFVCGGSVASQGRGGYDTGNGRICRVNKDMTHRQYYTFSGADYIGANHCFPSWNNDFIAMDADWVGVGSLKTNQSFVITNIYWPTTQRNHPYHAHAQVAWGDGNYMLSWGHVYKDVLGVAWYDYSEIVENEIPDGGRYKLNDDVECVSYETLVCETDEVVKDGRTTRRIKSGNELYIAVNPEIADTTDDAVKVTFEYLDNSREPIKLVYTRGVKDETSDIINVYNASRQISRRRTNKWKTATITLDSANMESIGDYESDFRIIGGAKDTYIANIKVEKVEK